MVLNVNHCPVWVFDVVACVVAREFLQSPLSLDSVSSKFQKGMAANYNSIAPVHLVTAAEQVLITLSEANAGEAAITILEGFCYFRLNYEMNKVPRKISGIFVKALKGDKEPRYTADDARKRFKAYLFAMRNGGMPVPPQEWSLEKDETIPALTQLIVAKASILDSI